MLKSFEKMATNVMQRVVGPALRRMGSVVAGVLVAAGMSAEGAAQVEMALIALAAFAVDLILSNFDFFRGKK